MRGGAEAWGPRATGRRGLDRSEQQSSRLAGAGVSAAPSPPARGPRPEQLRVRTPTTPGFHSVNSPNPDASWLSKQDRSPASARPAFPPSRQPVHQRNSEPSPDRHQRGPRVPRSPEASPASYPAGAAESSTPEARGPTPAVPPTPRPPVGSPATLPHAPLPAARPRARLTWQMQAAGAGERAGAARAAGRGALQQEAVVGAAQQLVLPQRELVSREQLAAAHGAAEALDVVHAVPRPHHQVAAAEAHLALGALDAEQPAGPGAAGVSAGRRRGVPLPQGPNPGPRRLT